MNQILEDMLRACVLHYGKNWDKCLSLAEFSYNNSYQSSLKMAPFEALYGRRCRTPLNWSQAGEREIFGPDLVLEAEEKVRVIKKNLEAAQARQRSYHDKRRKPLQFEVGDHVYLKGLLYAVFSYNNSYQASIKMSHFEAFYGRRCQTPLSWYLRQRKRSELLRRT